MTTRTKPDPALFAARHLEGPCPDCDGEGMSTYDCRCHGGGLATSECSPCGRCGGTGKVWPLQMTCGCKCVECDVSHSKWPRCQDCGDRGWIPVVDFTLVLAAIQAAGGQLREFSTHENRDFAHVELMSPYRQGFSDDGLRGMEALEMALARALGLKDD